MRTPSGPLSASDATANSAVTGTPRSPNSPSKGHGCVLRSDSGRSLPSPGESGRNPRASHLPAHAALEAKHSYLCHPSCPSYIRHLRRVLTICRHLSSPRTHTETHT